ncbi:RhoGEF Gef1 [Schizosaccharomyces cryophilus OY26]|uniref:RhoGEF Gef1 n=1 Tax=Schizosaccharomyces cryophilus (strain OY26 / ATCC MYA-4695 / CBS 11777 / NBRC 106824 / NRRL Y48691) TaxID=653667 RepID=S9X7B6_SCHCR|nr:RhoGEF Gef1 [Schizosaccharomyces cryophilus OY26]EPY49666.1 RhoGEF Gef1 [Schizosaccharomyces cryophilus OY26]
MSSPSFTDTMETFSNRDLPRPPNATKLQRTPCIKRKSVNLSFSPGQSFLPHNRPSIDLDSVNKSFDGSSRRSYFEFKSPRSEGRFKRPFARILGKPLDAPVPLVSQHRRYFSEGSFRLPHSKTLSLNSENPSGKQNENISSPKQASVYPKNPRRLPVDAGSNKEKRYFSLDSLSLGRRLSDTDSSQTLTNSSSPFPPQNSSSGTIDKEDCSSATFTHIPSSYSSSTSFLSPSHSPLLRNKVDSPSFKADNPMDDLNSDFQLGSSMPPTPTSLNDGFDSPTHVTPLPPDYKRIKKRANLIQELVTTEANYLNDLIAIQQCYGLRVHECSVLNVIDIQTVFGDIEPLLTFSVDFHYRLYKGGEGAWRVNESTQLFDPSPCNLGLVFLESLTDISQIYSGYCNRQDAVFRIITKWREKPAVSSWVTEGDHMVQQFTNAWDLGSLIIKPLQRLLKYPLLLQKIIDATPESSPERPDLILSYQLLQELIANINQKQKPSHKRGSLSTSHKRDAGWALLNKSSHSKSKSASSNDFRNDRRYNFQRSVLQDLRRKLAIIKAFQSSVDVWYMNVLEGFSVFERILANLENVSILDSEESPEAWRKFHLLAHMMTVNTASHIQPQVMSDVQEPTAHMAKMVQKVIQFIVSAESIISSEKLKGLQECIDNGFHSIVYKLYIIQCSVYQNYAENVIFLIPESLKSNIIEESEDFAALVRAFEPMHYEDQQCLEECMKKLALSSNL